VTAGGESSGSGDAAQPWLWRPGWVPAPAPAPAGPMIADGACDLWRIDLEAVAAAGGGDPAVSPLDAAERARAARFVFERHRRWYTAARTALRSIVGAYLGIEPAAVPIEIERLGRPRLGAAIVPPLDFNLSHCDALAVLAVARRGPLGVDVECVREMKDALALAQRHFVGDEIDRVTSATGAVRDAAFFTCWTRKEAVLKSTGAGLSVEPCSVRVGATPQALRLEFLTPDGVVPLELCSFVVREGALGACAFAPGVRIAATYDFGPSRVA
jgi:4'-phosphopantetheinyl transferase